MTQRRCSRSRALRSAGAPLLGPARRVPAAAHPQSGARPIRRRARGAAGARVLDVGCGGGLLCESARARRRERHRHRSRAGHDRSGAPARRRAGPQHRLSRLRCGDARRAATTWSPAWRCSSTCRIRRRWSRRSRGWCGRAATLFISTINRNLKSFLLAIVGAEYVLRLIPRGTHEYERLIRPAELGRWARAAGLEAARDRGPRIRSVHGALPPEPRSVRQLSDAPAAQRAAVVSRAGVRLRRAVRSRRHAARHRARHGRGHERAARRSSISKPLPFATIRPFVSHGANALVRLGFPDSPDDEFAVLRERFLAIYRECLAKDTVLFAGTAEMLGALEAPGIPWGIVTNKPTWLTEPLLEALSCARASVSLVCGDTFPERKPHPRRCCMPLRELRVAPENCLYVGDAERDIVAARAAQHARAGRALRLHRAAGRYRRVAGRRLHRLAARSSALAASKSRNELTTLSIRADRRCSFGGLLGFVLGQALARRRAASDEMQPARHVRARSPARACARTTSCSCSSRANRSGREQAIAQGTLKEREAPSSSWSSRCARRWRRPSCRCRRSSASGATPSRRCACRSKASRAATRSCSARRAISSRRCAGPKCAAAGAR